MSVRDAYRQWSDQQYKNFQEQQKPKEADASKYDFGFIDDYKFPSQQKGMLDDLLQQSTPNANQFNPDDIFGDYFNNLNQQAQARKAQQVQQPDQPDFATLEAQSMQGVTPPQPQEPSLWEAVNNKDKFEQKFSGFTDLMKKLSKPVHDFMDDTAPGQFIQRLSETGADTSTAGTSAIGRDQKASTGNNVADTIADILGMAAGTVANPGGAPSLGNVMNETRNLGGSLFDKATQNLNPTSKLENFLQGLSKNAVEGTAAGVPFALSDQANDAMYTDKSLAERAKEVAQESALFGLGDGALYGVGKGVGKALDATGIPQKMALARELNNATPEAQNPLDALLNRPASIYEAKPIQQTVDRTIFEPPLALPAPEKSIAQTLEELSGVNDNYQAPRNPPKTSQNLAQDINDRAGITGGYVPSMQEVERQVNTPLDNAPKGKFKVVNPASKQLDELYQLAQERGLPPGREYEYLQGLWSEIAPKEAGSLDDLIQAASKEVSAQDLVRSGQEALQNTKDAQKYGVYPNYRTSQKGTVKEQIPVNSDPNFVLRGGPLVPLEKSVSQNERNGLEDTFQLLKGLKTVRTQKEVNPYPTFEGNKGLFKLPVKQQAQQEVAATLDRIPRAPVKQNMEEVLNQLPKKAPQVPEPIVGNQNSRGFINTLQNSAKTSEEVQSRLNNDPRNTYTPITNKDTVNVANKRVAQNIDEAASFVMNADKATPEHVAVAHRLIDEFQKAGNYNRAVDVAEKIAELGTKAGQSIQAFSIYNRLSPEGILVHATRIANRVNERLRPGQKPVEVTGEMAAQLKDLASTVQTMTGTKEVANNVISIMEKAKAGTKLTSDEMKQIQQFTNDAKKFIGEQTPKAKAPKKTPTLPKEPAIRNQVVSFLDQQEQAARERIATRKGRLNSLPVDELADYAIIGASKMAKGAVKFSVWSEQMIKDFGESIKPHLTDIFDKSVETINSHTDTVKNTKLSEVEKITNKALKTAELSPDEAESLRKMAMEVSKLSGDQKIEASQELQATLQLLDRPTVLQKINSIQTQAQLLNPKTILTRNPLGNELFYRMERINKYLATPIDWARSKVTGGDRTVTFKTAGQTGYWKGLIQGVKAGWKGVNVNGLETQFDLKGQAFKGKWNPLTYTEKALGATLRGFDNAAYQRAVNETMGELATLRAVNEGLQGQAKKEAIQRYIRQMDENGLAIAHEYGKYITFQDNNILSMKLQSLKKGLNSLNEFAGIKDTSWGLGDILLKYPKTPGAIVMRALDYSPAGFLRSLYIASEPFFRKGVERNTREATQAIARAITGSAGLTGLGWYLADVGILTGEAADDPDIRELQKSAGEGQFKLNVTAMKRFVLSGWDRKAAAPQKGDTFASYDWAQPLAIPLSAGANISQNMKQKKNPMDHTGNTVLNSVMGGLTSIVEQPVLQGITKPFRGYNAADSFEKTLQDIPASFVPTILNQIRQLTDNSSRSTFNKDGLQETLNKLKNKTPGMEKDLPLSYDTLGRPKEVYQNGSNNLFNVFLNPSNVNEYQPSKVEQLLIDLYNKTGNKNIAPRVPDKYLMEKGKKIDLTPEQYSELQKNVGKATMKGLERVNPNMNDDQKIKRIINILNEAGKVGRDKLKRDYHIK